MLAILLGPGWSQPIPQWSWVLETADRLLVVDAGEHPEVQFPGAFDPVNQFIYHRCFRTRSIDPLAIQMKRVGLDPQAVETIIQTHLHFDHADALIDFPRAQVLVQDSELRFHRHRREGSRPVSWLPERFRPLEGDLEVVPGVRLLTTPGHTPGHQSVWLEQLGVLLAGDLTFSERQLLAGVWPGISCDLTASRASRHKVLGLASRAPTVYWPSHDPEGLERFQARETLA